MKWIKYTCLTVAVGSMAVAAQAAPVIDKPAVLTDAMLSLTVSDLHGFIDEAGMVAAKVSPMINGMMIKQMIGGQLGDPMLAGVAPGKGLAVVALDTTNFFAVVEVAEGQSAAYARAIGNMGMQSKYASGLLVLAQTPEQLAKGSALAGRVQAKLLAKRSPTLRVSAQPAALIERNNDALQGFLQMMPAMMGASLMQAPGTDPKTVNDTTKLLEGEMRVLLSLCSQCESGELVLAPKNGSIQLSETFVPKAGSRLAALIESPKTATKNPAIQSRRLNEGMVMADFAMASPEAMADFINAEADILLKAMKIEEVDLAALTGVVTKWMKLYSGSACETFSFDAESGMSINYLLEVADLPAALELLKSMEKDMAPFVKLYENMGMPMQLAFREKVREHKGIPIHRLDMKISMEEMPADQQAQMAALKLDELGYDIALFDGMMLYTMGATKIETLIDRVKAGGTVEPIQARAVYPEGGCYYLDFDVGGYVEMIGAFLPEGAKGPMLPQIMALMQGVDPITSAGFRQEGRAMWSVNIPGDLIGKLGQFAMMMQMQQMQQQGMPIQ
ncbi:hypothetical protein [Pontiella sp.]|uniref:hypothetical protein n=1 Tax=Pontiella sp. TaxID=2837462 RepID=UPI0035614A1B